MLGDLGDDIALEAAVDYFKKFKPRARVFLVRCKAEDSYRRPPRGEPNNAPRALKTSPKEGTNTPLYSTKAFKTVSLLVSPSTMSVSTSRPLIFGAAGPETIASTVHSTPFGSSVAWNSTKPFSTPRRSCLYVG